MWDFFWFYWLWWLLWVGCDWNDGGVCNFCVLFVVLVLWGELSVVEVIKV